MTSLKQILFYDLTIILSYSLLHLLVLQYQQQQEANRLQQRHYHLKCLLQLHGHQIQRPISPCRLQTRNYHLDRLQ